MSDDGISREPMLDMYLFEGNQLVEQLEDIIASYIAVESALNQTAFLRKMEIDQVDDYPEAICALRPKQGIVLEDMPAVDQQPPTGRS